MRVLWFSINPSLYNSQRDDHNGGGWIESLERIVHSVSGIELGIVFLSQEDSPSRVEMNGTIYYPLFFKRNFFEKIIDKYTYKKIDPLIINRSLECIEDFKPDIIHIFGSEFSFGLLSLYTKIPIVIHMQGCWPPYENAQFPPGVSFLSYALSLMKCPKKLLGLFLRSHLFKERTFREELVLKHTNFFMGRTRWDYSISKLYSPFSSYYFCSEALRNSFYNAKKWELKRKETFRIVSIGGPHFLKGYDVILKTAKLLVKLTDLKFEWILIGPSTSSMEVYEKITGINCKDVHVMAMGKQDESDIIQILLDSHLFVHASYIDNSSNAICEAQYIGMPIIATNSGGTPSLFASDYDATLLVPTNDPYYLASKIYELTSNEEKMLAASKSNISIAETRHNPNNIKKSLLETYESIIKREY